MLDRLVMMGVIPKRGIIWTTSRKDVGIVEIPSRIGVIVL